MSAPWRADTCAPISGAQREITAQFAATTVFTGVSSEIHVAPGAGAGSGAGLDQTC